MLRNTLNTFITATFIMLLGVSSSAKAIVPMGDLMGTTSVTWGNDNQETTKPTALRVDLVPAAPRIKQDTSDESIDEQQPGVPVTVTYTITSRANGPDDYALAADYDDGAAAEANLEQPGPTTEILGADDQPASVNLGATAATGRPIEDSTTITVICDKNYRSNSETNCNGIEASDTVIIGDGDTAYTVADGGVSNTGDGPSTIMIDLGEVDALPSIVVGTRIAEQKTFEVVVTGVALRDPAEPGAVSLAVTGTSTGGNQGRELLAFDVPANPIPHSVDRYVRNLTDPDRNPADADVESTELPLTDGDADTEREAVNYYKTGVSAEEGDEVEILIVLKAGNLKGHTDIMLTDTLSPFVEYIEGSTLFFANGGKEGASMVPSSSKYEWILELEEPAGQRTIDLAKNTSAHLTYRMTVIGGEETVPSGDGGGDGGVGGGDGDSGEVGDSNNDMAAEFCRSGGAFVGEDWKKCKNEPWIAAKGINSRTNPLCWKADVAFNSGQNPWVVGEARYDKDIAYECRTKCAAESASAIGHCANNVTIIPCRLDPTGLTCKQWWKEEYAKRTTCTYDYEPDSSWSTAKTQSLNEFASGYYNVGGQEWQFARSGRALCAN